MDSFVKGQAHAFDNCWGSETRASSVLHTVQLMKYTYVGSLAGAVTHTAHVEIGGQANLVRAKCAAAAVGYVQIESTLPAANLLAKLENSAGETHAEGLGSISLPGVNLEVNVHFGRGRYPDSDGYDAAPTEECLDYFSVTHIFHGRTEAWAAAQYPYTPARVNANMHGAARSDIDLFEVEPCPATTVADPNPGPQDTSGGESGGLPLPDNP